MDEMANEAHISEEKAKKAMVDAARLADELRAEQVTPFPGIDNVQKLITFVCNSLIKK